MRDFRCKKLTSLYSYSNTEFRRIIGTIMWSIRSGIFFGDRNVNGNFEPDVNHSKITPKICHQHHVNNIDWDFLVQVCWGWYNSKRFLWWNRWCWCRHFCMLHMCKKQFQTVTFSHYHFRWCLARFRRHVCQIDILFDDRYVRFETVLRFFFRFRLFYRKIKLFKTALRKIIKCAQASFFQSISQQLNRLSPFHTKPFLDDLIKTWQENEQIFIRRSFWWRSRSQGSMDRHIFRSPELTCPNRSWIPDGRRKSSATDRGRIFISLWRSKCSCSPCHHK